MKKFLFMLLILVAAFSLSACRRDNDDDDNGDDTQTTEDLVNDAMGRLSFSNMGAYEGSSISLPTSLIHGVSVSWSSSNTEVVSNTGAVTRPFGGDPVDVTITGTFSLQDVSKTKDFVFTIMPIELVDLREEYPEAPYFDDFEAMFDAEPTGKIIVEGVVSTTFAWGFFIFDGENHFAIYYGRVPPQGERYQVGDRVQFYGDFDNYYTLYQINQPNDSALVGKDDDLTIPVTDSSVAEVNQLDSSDPLIHGQHFTVRGTLERRQEGSFTNTYIVDGDHELYVYHLSWTSSLEVLIALEGEYVELDVVYYVYHTRDDYIMVVFEGTADDVTVLDLTDEDKAEMVANQINLGDTSEVIADLVLPTTGTYDSTISWSSSDTNVIANDGTVTLPLTDSVDVTLTATVTVGTETYIREIVVTVMPESFVATGISVADALLEADGEVVRVEGVVTSYPEFFADQGFFIQDSDGTAIFVNEDLDVEVGNKVIIRGTLGTSTTTGNQRRQLNSPTLFANDNDTHSVFVVTDKTLNDIASDYPATQSIRYRVENIEFIEMEGSFFVFETGEDKKLRFHSGSYGTYLLGLLEAEDTIDWVEFTIYDIFEGDLRAVGVVLPEPTLEQVEAIAENQLDVSGAKSSNVSLPDELVISGVNYRQEPETYSVTWSSSDTSVITDEGVITRPTMGEPDAEAVMTATFTFGTETVVVEFAVTVRALTEDSETLLVYDFGSVNRTGYAEGDLTWTTTDGIEVTAFKNRVQINTSDFAPHKDKGRLLVMSVNDQNLEAFIDFDFTDSSLSAMTHIELEISRWAPWVIEEINGLDLATLSTQVWNESTSTWETVDTLDLQNFLTDEYQTVKLATPGAGVYRLIYNAEGTEDDRNTNYAITIISVSVISD